MSVSIAIIGAGIAGLASASHLARAGHQVTIFERFDKPAPIGAGLLLQPSGLDALESLQLREQAQARGARVSRLIGRTVKGRAVLDLRYQDGRPGDIGIGIHRASLFGLLYNTALNAGVKWRSGTQVLDVPDPDTGQLSLDDGILTRPFDLVLVCDGAQSTLRGKIFPEAKVKRYRWGAYFGRSVQTRMGCAMGSWNKSITVPA